MLFTVVDVIVQIGSAQCGRVFVILDTKSSVEVLARRTGSQVEVSIEDVFQSAIHVVSVGSGPISPFFIGEPISRSSPRVFSRVSGKC